MVKLRSVKKIITIIAIFWENKFVYVKFVNKVVNFPRCYLLCPEACELINICDFLEASKSLK